MGQIKDNHRGNIEQLFDDAVRRGAEQRLMDGLDDYLRGRSSWTKSVRRVAAVAALLLATTAVATTVLLPIGRWWAAEAPVQDTVKAAQRPSNSFPTQRK